MPTQLPWNINIHYNALVDAQVPVGAQQVLDVGCGDGFLAARLAERIPSVVALDVDEPVLQRAIARFPSASVRWTHGDVMTAALPLFDAVVSNAAMHHIEDTGGARASGRPAAPRRHAGCSHICQTVCARGSLASDVMDSMRCRQSDPGQVGTYRSHQVATAGHLRPVARSRACRASRRPGPAPALRTRADQLAVDGRSMNSATTSAISGIAWRVSAFSRSPSPRRWPR